MHTLTPRLNRRQFQWGLAAAAALTLSGCGPSNAAPASRFLLLDGSTVTDADLRGQVTLINFWATTCVTCVQKMPDLVALYQRHRERGFDTIAVAMSHDPPEWVANFARTRQLPFKVALDHNGALARDWGEVRLTPTTFVLDRQARIVKRYLGPTDATALNAFVEGLLAQS
ncbi:MAG: redoxin [Comamonadaceae bacterium]|nr:redoxin [Comamonadaceae bacterium]